MVLANELLDNLPFGLAERRDDGWHEVRADLATAADGVSRLVELLVPLGTERAAVLDRLAPDAAGGARVPLQDAARAWLREALAVAGPRGRVVVVDYAATTAELAARPPGEWVRTYRAPRPRRRSARRPRSPGRHVRGGASTSSPSCGRRRP